VNQVVNSMLARGATIDPPKDRKVFDSLYKELWRKLKDCDFKLDILNSLKNKRFPLMPFLTSEWWVIDPRIDLSEAE
jgi:hypothetical protein